MGGKMTFPADYTVKTGYPHAKMRLYLYLTPCIKITLKWTIFLSVKARSYKTLRRK